MEARASGGDGKVGWEQKEKKWEKTRRHGTKGSKVIIDIILKFHFLFVFYTAALDRSFFKPTNPYKSNQKFNTQKISHEINTSPWQQLDKFSLWNVNKCFIPRAPSVKFAPNLAGCFYPSTLVCYQVDWLEQFDEFSSDDKWVSIEKRIFNIQEI